MTEADQALYQNFSLVVSERWQLEIAETVFEVVNQEADKLDAKRARARQRSNQIAEELGPASGSTVAGGSVLSAGSSAPFGLGSSTTSVGSSSGPSGDVASQDGIASDCIVEGEVLKLGGPFMQTWQRKHLRLFPNRLELYNKSRDGLILKKGVEVSIVFLISMMDIKEISPEFCRVCKMDHCISIKLKTDGRIYLTSNDKVLITQWREEILEGYRLSCEIMAHMNKKAHKMYGVPDVVGDPVHSTPSHANASSQRPHGTQALGVVQPTRTNQKSHSPPQASTPQRPRLSHQVSMPNYSCTTSAPQQTDAQSPTPKPNDSSMHPPTSPTPGSVNNTSDNLIVRDGSTKKDRPDSAGAVNPSELATLGPSGGKILNPS
ncbi:unnamed protein product [Echinostoma caproni]|uniref:PH domain-containing protein n=1 Tax=Echinostoma caproni TaxID=27848 RepID=A0A3P8KZC7_9TREM|nr:unnamed protein product [Echinostoma caproni]